MKQLKAQDYMHIYNFCTLLSFYEELCMFLIGSKVLNIGPFIFYIQIYILVYFDNLVRTFDWLFGRQ